MPATARTTTALVVAAVLAAAAPACNSTERVDLSFRVEPPSRSRYEIEVSSEVTTDLGGEPDSRTETLRLTVDQEVVARRPGSTELRLDVQREGTPIRHFDIVVDTDAGIATVRSVEGLPAEAFGGFDTSRLLLLASGLLPERAVRPGEVWDIARVIDLPDGEQHLSGTGRLESITTDDPSPLARVTSRTTLPVDQVMALPEGRVQVRGTELAVITAQYALDDGALHQATSRTTGHFSLVIDPPTGQPGEPVRGTLEVTVESESRRVAPAGRAR